jgi:hypothetical protein
MRQYSLLLKRCRETPFEDNMLLFMGGLHERSNKWYLMFFCLEFELSVK